MTKKITYSALSDIRNGAYQLITEFKEASAGTFVTAKIEKQSAKALKKNASSKQKK